MFFTKSLSLMHFFHFILRWNLLIVLFETYTTYYDYDMDQSFDNNLIPVYKVWRWKVRILSEIW